MTIQIKAFKNILGANPVDTVYFGGGTPTILSEKQFTTVVECLKDTFRGMKDCKEICIEGCPKSIIESTAKLQTFKQQGVNRISIGVQSFIDKELKWLGRSHTSTEAYKAIESVYNTGIDHLNIDLIYGMDEQRNDELIYNLEELAKISPQTVTLYPLNIRKNTKLYQEQEGTGAKDSQRMFEMYDITKEFMKKTDTDRRALSFILKVITLPDICSKKMSF